MDTSNPPDPDSLRRLIGQRVVLQQQQWLVIDLLPEIPALVLEQPGQRVIQTDQHGEGRRRVAPTMTLPITDDSGRPTPEFLDLQATTRSAPTHP